jgi:hypothetical protein
MEPHARAHTEQMGQASTSQLQLIRAPPAPADLRARGQDPSALLRTASTSIPHVNRTDVETHRRPAFDVRLPTRLLLALFSDRTCRGQSFAQIAAAQLALLPGFRLKTVGRQAEGRVFKRSSSRARRATRSELLLFRASLEPVLLASLFPVLAAAAPTCSFPRVHVCANAGSMVPDGRTARRSGTRGVLCGIPSCSGPMMRRMQVWPTQHVRGASQNIDTQFCGRADVVVNRK